MLFFPYTQSLTTAWNHDADPTDGLQVNQTVARFRQEMAADPKYLQKYVQRYFVVSQLPPCLMC